MFRPTILEPSTNVRAQVNLTERLLKHTDKVREKKKIKKIDIELEEQKKAIPEPAPKPIFKSRFVGHDYRMYDYQMKMEQQRKAKVVEMVLEENRKEREVLTNPSINHRSQKLASKRPMKGKVYDRLFEESKDKQARKFKHGFSNYSRDGMLSENGTFSDLKQCTFQPDIGSTKNRPAPQGRVEERLLNDAKKRLMKKVTMVAEASKTFKKQAKQPKSVKTQEYAFKKFTKEYEESLIDMSKEKGSIFSFEELCLLLFKLGFISERDQVDKQEGIVADVWIIIGGEAQDEVTETSIYHILCVIMNFDQPFLYTSERFSSFGKEVDPTTVNEGDRNTVGLIGKDGCFYLRSPNEIQRLHSYLYDLTFNRINYINKQSKLDKVRNGQIEEMKEQQRNSYKPKIDSLSKTIEESKNELYGKVARYNLLLSKGERYNSKRSEMVNENKDKELDGCTFKPVTNRYLKFVNRKSMGDESKMDIKQTKAQFWDSINQQKSTQNKNNKSKKLWPKVNKVIMDIFPGKDPIVHSQELVNEYNAIGGRAEHGENQQSTSLDEKINQAQQCYKPVSASDLYKPSKPTQDFQIEHKLSSIYVDNYMEQKFDEINQEAHEQFSHNQDERVTIIDRKLTMRYDIEHGDQNQ